MFVTLYSLPNGNNKLIEFKNVKEEDEKWFEDYNVSVSMETLSSGEFVLYADCGIYEEDPLEAIVIVKEGESAFDSMSRLREEAAKMVLVNQKG